MQILNNKLEKFQVHDHIIGIYKNRKEKFSAAFDFIKKGLENNAVVMLITDDMNKNNIRKKITSITKTDAINFEKNGDLIIKSTSDWYFPQSKVDIARITNSWSDTVQQCLQLDKKTLWVFADTKAFFENGLGKELVNYEISLPQKFSLPMVAVCAYDAKHIDTMSTTELNNLYKHHNLKWIYYQSPKENTPSDSLFYIMSRFYALDILRALSKKPSRFSELHVCAPNESTRATRLKELEDSKLISTESRKVQSRHFVYYHITKKGIVTLAKINSLK